MRTGKFAIIREWSDGELVRELRNPMREGIEDTLLPIIAEGVARLISRKRTAATAGIERDKPAT